MRRALVVVIVPLVLLAGCTGDGEQATPTPSPSEPTASPSPQETQQVTAWFVRVTQTDFFVESDTTLGPATEGVARAAFEFLFRHEPANPALSNVAKGIELRDVRRDGDVLVVDVSGSIDAPGTGHGSMEEAALAEQLAHTAVQFEGVRAVRLLVEGQPVQDLWGHLDWSRPMEPGEFKQTPITISVPAWGAQVPAGELLARGEANTFEATLGVRLIAPDGRIVEQEWITATSGSGTRGTWQHRFTVSEEAGTWAIEAEEPDPSGGAEGRRPLVVRVEFTVT